MRPHHELPALLVVVLTAGLLVAGGLGGCAASSDRDERDAVEHAALAPFRDIARRDARALCGDLTLSSARRLAGDRASNSRGFAARCPRLMRRALARAERLGNLSIIDSFARTQRVVNIAVTGDQAVARIALQPGDPPHPSPLARDSHGDWRARFSPLSAERHGPP